MSYSRDEYQPNDNVGQWCILLIVEVGDLVTYQGQRWFVSNYDRTAKVFALFNIAGERIELPREIETTSPDQLQVVVKPSAKWQLLTAPVKSSSGPFVRMVIPGLPGRAEIVLEPWVDWIPSDPLREGGSFFINPERKIRPGVLLLATHRNGAVVRVMVPQTVGTIQRRKKAREAHLPVKEVSNRYTKIMKGFENGDD